MLKIGIAIDGEAPDQVELVKLAGKVDLLEKKVNGKIICF